MAHEYTLTKSASGNTIVTCSECGPEGMYPDGEAVTAFVQVHDRHHALERAVGPGAVTQAQLDTWLEDVDPGIWEPSAEERSGHVAIPLGYVIIEAAIAAAATHECPAVRRAKGYTVAGEPVALRILDCHGKASDHVLDAETAVDLSCIIEELVADTRAARSWRVRREAGAPDVNA